MPGIKHRSRSDSLPGITPAAKFRCVLVGEGTLPLQCAELLIANGHEIVAIAMPPGDGQEWALNHAVPLLAPADDLAGALASRPVDYLFSVANPRVIPASVLALPRRGAINYHDSLLPRYAGVHATSWAMIAGEREHGVTWHAMDVQLDHGQVLAQERVAIDSNDTALTLNAKCYEAAIRAFARLVTELETGAAIGHAQDLAHRSYFAKHTRPPAACAIDWAQDATMIDAFTRALWFGDFYNALGTPKVFIGGHPFACPRASAITEAHGAAPGTVLRVEDDGIIVAAGANAVRIPALTTLEGDPVAIGDLVAAHALATGDVLTLPQLVRDEIGARDKAAARAERAWIARLADLQPPTLRMLPAAGPNGATFERRAIPVETPQRFAGDDVAAREAALCAAFAILLARVADVDALDVGITTGGREPRHTDAADVFATQLPCRIVVDRSASFAASAAAVRASLADLAVGGPIGRDVWSRIPVLRHGVTHQWRNGLPFALALGGAAPGDLSGEHVTLVARRAGGATLSFRSDIVDDTTAHDLAHRLELILADAAARPDVPVGDLRLMSKGEEQRILVDWNDTDAVSKITFVHHAFADRARSTPDATAVTYEDAHLSYAELDRRANRLAWALRERGVTRDTRVGVCIPRSPELIVALLGILKAGGAYVPLMPEHPQARTNAILLDADPLVIVTVASVRDQFDTRASALLVLDQAGAELDRHRDDVTPDPVEAPTSAAYVMYTSGSTGLPKGVIVPHQALGNLAEWVGSLVPLSHADSVMHKTPLSFDPSGLEIFAALTAGARLVLARDDAHQDLAYVLELMARERVTAVVFIPSALAASVELHGFARACEALRLVIIGGEVLTAGLVAHLHAAAPGVEVFNLYGPTEATIACTGWCARSDVGATGPLPIGRPVPNVRAYVLDRSLRPIPPGVEGELCIGGVQVASGYLARPALTADRFVSDPFTHREGARLYRTGDRAVWRRDGVLEFRGRMDEQLKVRGFRVEPGEVEHAILVAGDVKECVVVRVGEAEHARLAAYVVAAAGRVVDVAALAERLRAQLPAHMLPAAYVVLDALPLTVNGKVDTRALPDVDVTHEDRQGCTAPRTSIESSVCTIWSEVLGRTIADVHDDFFERGGNSLLATRALTRVRERLGVEISLRAMFDATTVERFASVVEAARDARTPGRLAVSTATLMTGEPLVEAPLSFAQELLWMLDRTHPGLWAYNLWDASRITGPCDERILADALNDVVQRHAALRTSFVGRGDGAVQRIAPTVTVPLAIADLRSTPPCGRETRARQVTLDAIRRPFDLATAPLLRASFVRIGDDTAVFVLVFHHMLADGWSRDVLVRDLSACYAARVQGVPASFATLRLDYPTFALQQRASWTGDSARELLDYWTDSLAGAPDVLELPTDHARPAIASFDGATCSVAWSATLRESLRAMSASAGTTLFMTVFAGVQTVLARYSGQDDFVIGTPVLGRRVSAAEDVVGYFAGVVPLRSDVAGDPTFDELLRRVRARCVAALDHQDVPFGELVAALGHPVDPGHSPIFQVMLAVEDDARAPLTLEGASVRSEPVEVGSSKYDLWLTITDTGTGLIASAEYRTDLFERATVQRLLEHIEVVLGAAAATPTRAVSTLPMATAADRLELARWNATATDTPAVCIHELIAAQAERTPHAVALTGGEGDLTYAQLDARANRLAHYLARNGVVPGALVGVCVEPSFDLIVALIAVMKGGAAYVPLDPAYPPERLAFMVRDSAIGTLVGRAASAPLIPAFDGTTVLIDRDAPIITAESSSAPALRVSSDQPAYVIYTSGSTGVPKGAVLPHRAVSNYLLWMRDAIEATASDCVIQKAPVSFDASVWELYLPLISGGRVVVVHADTQREPLLLLGSMATLRATVVQFVPSLLSAVLDAPGFAVACRHVRLIVLGGEALPGELVRRVRAVLPDVQLLNLYGPTEAAVYATAYPIPAECTDAIVPIGTPIANVQVHVMSGNAVQVLPAGIPGELVIAGVGVGTGYLDRPALTAERFIDDPFTTRNGARMYRTGDRARWRHDGTLEFLGRLDDQVKIRGFRVELGEVEHALSLHPDVRECAVVSRPVAGSAPRLIAYLVTRDGAASSSPDLRAWIAARLPEHMVPAAFVQMDALPLGVTGKLDRRALPEATIEATEYHAPRGSLEGTIAATWSEVFGIARIGRNDDFFHLGGHSLLAMRVVLRLGAQLGIQLPMRILFDGRTVAGVAAAIEREHPVADARPIAELLAALDEMSDEQARELLAQ